MSDLGPFRERLDEIDGKIIELFGQRFQVCRDIAEHKREHDIPMMQSDRVELVRDRYLASGAELEVPRRFTADFFELLIGATCKLEDELIAAPGQNQRPPDPEHDRSE
jgi:chorismate mutase